MHMQLLRLILLPKIDRFKMLDHLQMAMTWLDQWYSLSAHSAPLRSMLCHCLHEVCGLLEAARQVWEHPRSHLAPRL